MLPVWMVVGYLYGFDKTYGSLKFLLGKSKKGPTKGLWNGYVGKRKPGESLLETLTREEGEEIGWVTSLVRHRIYFATKNIYLDGERKARIEMFGVGIEYRKEIGICTDLDDLQWLRQPPRTDLYPGDDAILSALFEGTSVSVNAYFETAPASYSGKTWRVVRNMDENEKMTFADAVFTKRDVQEYEGILWMPQSFRPLTRLYDTDKKDLYED